MASPRKPGESLYAYEQRRAREGRGSKATEKTPEQLRQDALYTAETKRLAEEAAMPQLEEYRGLETLEGGGRLQARTLTGADIQKEMEASPWYKMALEKQGLEQNRLLGQTQQQQAGQLAQARSNLAMRGGLSGGAAERMARAGAESGLLAAQNVRGAGALERSQLGMQGADLASRLGQFNIGQQSQTDLTNLQAQIANLAAQENRKLQKYGEQMKGYAAERTSEGIGSGGKK
jgi:hypothetical protein